MTIWCVGRELFQCIQSKSNYSVLSTGTSIYWPARINTMPDLLDFFVCSRMNPGRITINPSFDLFSDHSPILAILHSSVLLKLKYPKINLIIFKTAVENKMSTQVSLHNEQDLENATNSFMNIIKQSTDESVVPELMYSSLVSLIIRKKIKEKRRL